MSIYSAIHNGADPTTKRPVFNTRIVPSSAVRQQREHSWVWSRQSLIWRQVSQIPRGYHSHEAIGCDVRLSVQKVIWFWCWICKRSLFTVCPFNRIACPSTQYVLLSSQKRLSGTCHGACPWRQVMWLRYTWLHLSRSCSVAFPCEHRIQWFAEGEGTMGILTKNTLVNVRNSCLNEVDEPRRTHQSGNCSCTYRMKKKRGGTVSVPPASLHTPGAPPARRRRMAPSVWAINLGGAGCTCISRIKRFFLDDPYSQGALIL